MNLLNLMKTICFQLITLTLFRSFNCDISSNETHFGSEQYFANVKQDFDDLTKDFLESLKVAHKLVDTDRQKEELVRGKRSPHLHHRNTDSFSDKGVFRLRGIVPFHSTCDRPVDFTTIQFNGQIYGICVSQPNVQTRNAKVSVGPITHNGWERDRISWFVTDPRNVVAFVDEDKDTKESNLYVLTADTANSEGVNVMVINKYNQMMTKEQHTVNSRYPTAIAVWKSRTDDTYHLAIANSHGREKTQTYKSETFTYNWMQTYFDRYSEMTTYYVKDICPFHIHSNEFLAVANYMAGPNIVEVDSEIFKLDIDRKKWRSFQRIRTSGAVDWEYFTFGSDHNEEHFLAVANNIGLSDGRNRYDINSIIYKFSDDKFVPFQCLSTVGATQIKTYRGSNGEFVIAVANMHQAVHLYQYNGWHFVETSVQYTTGAMSPGVVSLHFDYLSFERSGVLFVSNPHHPSGHMFKLEFVYENPLGEWHNKSLEWCQRTELNVKQFGDNNLRPLLTDVFYIDQNQPIIINSDINVTDFIVDSLQTPILLDLNAENEFSHRFINDLIKLDEEIRSAEAKLAQIFDIVSNAVRTDGDQVLTAFQTFNSVNFDCRPEFGCNFGQISAELLNSDNINGLSEDIVPLNTDQNLNNSMHFQNLIIDKNIILHGVINGMNTSHIVTKQGSHDILAAKTLINDVTANEVVVNRRINQMVINPSTVLLANGDQVINHSLKFIDNIHINNLQLNGAVNGMDINRLFADIITKDSDHIISGQKYFNSIEVNELLIRPGSTLDGIDIIKLWNDVLWTYGYQEIVVPMNFTDLSIDRNLLVDGLINGISIPDHIIHINQNQLISGNKRFLRPVNISRAHILDSINGIGLVDRIKHDLDLMLKSKVQKVFGHKSLNKVHLGGHSLVRGTIDGIKLSQLQRSLIFRNVSQQFDTLEIRGNAYFDGGLDLKTTINGLKLEDLYNKALKLTDRHIPTSPQLLINLMKIGSIDCQSINGLNIATDLMTKRTPQIISGQKTFINGIKVNNDLIVRHINGINMNFFNDTLLHENQQYISGEKIFVNDLWVKNLIIKSINNISIDDLVLLNVDQTIPSAKVLTDVQIYNHLNVHSLESNVINDINLKEFFGNSLQYEKPQIITGRLNVESILIPKATNFETGSINGVKLNKLISDAVLIDIPQTVSGSKTFVAPISAERINFVDRFDNVSDFDLKYNWLLQDSDQTVATNLSFDNNIRVENNILMTTPTINNINLHLLNDNAVKVDEPALLVGQSNLVGNVISEGHIELSGRIQGIDLDKEAVILDRDNSVFGRIHFANGFKGDQHLFVNGTIDGIKVEELCRFAVRKDISQVITGPTVVTGNVLIKGPLNVSNDLNGVKINDFSQSVLKIDEPNSVKGIKHFRQLIIDGPILSRQLFAGFRIDKLFENYMSLSRDQMINSKIVFRNDINLNNRLEIDGNLLTANSSINGLDLNRLDTSLLKTTGDQLITGEFTFEDNVNFDKDLNIVNRKVNNLDLFRDLMLKGRNNTVNVPKIFTQNILVDTNLDIKHGMTIGGIDLSEMTKYTVMKDNGKHRVFGQKHFNSLEVDHLRTRLINGIEISDRSLLLTYGNQTITGNKVFRNGLTANQEINSKAINQINIRNLSESLVLKGYNNSINSFKTFNSAFNVNNVRAFGRVDGVDLNELNYFIGLPLNLLDLRVKLGIEDQKINAMQRALERQAIHLEFYERISTINSGPALLSYFNQMTGSQHLFVSGQYLDNGCQEVDVYLLINDELKSVAKLYAIEPNLMTTFQWNGNHFVVISNSKRVFDSIKCIQMNDLPNVVHYGKGPAVTQVFVFDIKQNNYKQMAVINSESVTDLKVIEDQNRYPCLLIVNPVVDGKLGHSLVLCINSNQNFYLRESVPLPGVDQISIIRSSGSNRTLMASINSWQTTDWMSNIVICDWSSQLAHFDHSIQSIPILNPSAIHFVESPVHSSIFLFAAEKKTSLTHKPLVRIFRFNQRQAIPMIEVQQIKQSEVRQIDSVLLDDHKVLVLMLSTDRIDLYSLKGSSGFVRVDTIGVQNAQNFIVSNNFKNNRISGHLISISLKLCYAKNRRICKEETHVLRSKFNVK